MLGAGREYLEWVRCLEEGSERSYVGGDGLRCFVMRSGLVVGIPEGAYVACKRQGWMGRSG